MAVPQVAALQNGARDADVPHHGDGDDQSVKASLKVFRVVPPRATQRTPSGKPMGAAAHRCQMRAPPQRLACSRAGGLHGRVVRSG
ncbi:hypothetical protein N9L68_05795 [bacterium]|nr:hypothetical protein [bacterium]